MVNCSLVSSVSWVWQEVYRKGCKPLRYPATMVFIWFPLCPSYSFQDLNIRLQWNWICDFKLTDLEYKNEYFKFAGKFFLCQQRKERIFWWLAGSVNRYTFSVCLNPARSMGRLQFLCAVYVLCINSPCGNTYHGLFIWGISLVGFCITLWLMGFQSG